MNKRTAQIVFSFAVTTSTLIYSMTQPAMAKNTSLSKANNLTSEPLNVSVQQLVLASTKSVMKDVRKDSMNNAVGVLTEINGLAAIKTKPVLLAGESKTIAE